jgi:hypothetical protein
MNDTNISEAHAASIQGESDQSVYLIMTPDAGSMAL